MNDFIESFKKEARELLENLERNLLSLEKDPLNKKIISEIFRILHTLKGTGSMFGYTDITEITHLLEAIFEKIRDDKDKVDDDILGLSLRTVDVIRAIIEDKKDENDYSNLLNSVIKYSPHFDNNKIKENGKASVFFIIYMPDKKIFSRGLNPLSVFDELSQIGEIESIIHNEKIPLEKQVEQRKCISWWEIYLHKNNLEADIDEVFMFNLEKEFTIIPILSEDDINSKILPALKEFSKGEKIDENKIKEIIVKYLSKTSAEETKQVQKAEEITPDKEKRNAQVSNSISVASEKLDEMMNLVSELVTANAELRINSDKIGNDSLELVAEKIDKISKKFKDNILSIRLIPVATLEVMIQRLVHDLSKSLKKEVKLITDGMDTELDKTIIHALESPLMHIIRNGIDHGIETVEERLKKNKQREGVIKFTSFYSGSNVFIQIQDDGRGIDFDKVRKAAIIKGFITQDQIVTEKELLELTLHPGFTTSENVSLVSGRGVGLDVVKNEISLLRGQLEINTEKDLGTIITIKLPITLSILDCLLLSVSNLYFLIAASEIEYCYQEKSANIFSKYSKKIEYLNELIPLISIRSFFEINDNEPEMVKIIIIKKDNERIALTVDQIIGKHQAVLKPLGNIFKNQEYLSGASILGDGNLALILDTNKLILELNKEKQVSIN